MDVVTRIIELADLHTEIDLRCKLGGSYRIDHEALAANSGSLPFHIVLGGDCIVALSDERRLTMKSGDFLMLSRGQGHAIVGLRPAKSEAIIDVRDTDIIPVKETRSEPSEVDILCGRFTYCTASSQLLMRSLPDVLHVSLTHDHHEDSIAILVGVLRSEINSDQPGALFVIKALSVTLLTMALRVGTSRDVRDSGIVAIIADPRVGKAIRTVFSDPGRTWRLEDVAALAGMSRSSLARRFAASGVSFATFLSELRMSSASQQLSSTAHSIGQIAASIGYLSEAAFMKAFKHHVGISPSKYRRAALKILSDDAARLLRKTGKT